jgi:hypothetical protein
MNCYYLGPKQSKFRSKWPRGLRRRSAAVNLLRFLVRIPPRTWMFICHECCVLSGRDLCNELITRPEESYRLWCVVVYDLVHSCHLFHGSSQEQYWLTKPEAVCTVMCSWWWAEEPPESCRASVKINKFKKRCILLFVIWNRNVIRVCVIWHRDAFGFLSTHDVTSAGNAWA